MNKNNIHKRLSINKIANTYNSRSRACDKCIFNKLKHYIFIDITRYSVEDICKQCNKSFVEGFTKGYKYKQKEITDVKIYNYINKARKKVKVACTRHQYLLLKLTYGKDGLTNKEYKEYKSL